MLLTASFGGSHYGQSLLWPLRLRNTKRQPQDRAGRPSAPTQRDFVTQAGASGRSRSQRGPQGGIPCWGFRQVRGRASARPPRPGFNNPGSDAPERVRSAGRCEADSRRCLASASVCRLTALPQQRSVGSAQRTHVRVCSSHTQHAARRLRSASAQPHRARARYARASASTTARQPVGCRRWVGRRTQPPPAAGSPSGLPALLCTARACGAHSVRAIFDRASCPPPRRSPWPASASAPPSGLDHCPHRRLRLTWPWLSLAVFSSGSVTARSQHRL